MDLELFLIIFNVSLRQFPLQRLCGITLSFGSPDTADAMVVKRNHFENLRFFSMLCRDNK